MYLLMAMITYVTRYTSCAIDWRDFYEKMWRSDN